ncbi:hypothetical protein [Streptomyces marincola]|uniref:Uncharacterized protein n=1 Tax=Streptomyces marincola TaxID=2878388 RepID=A0A1W7D0B6_9ACTN|nr:hypothetical protein [Streptomyces marincola]ARQ70359.1 hypothetical protein CAG99_17265 [Streptomyces marincola]
MTETDAPAGPAAVDTYASRTPDAEGWRGVPFVHPAMDGGKHDGGPMPPEAPRPPEPGPPDDGR